MVVVGEEGFAAADLCLINMIKIKDIVKTYQSGNVETKALKGVSFEIQKGEFVAVMGPSGSGKSTLMHIMGCLDAPTNGAYILDGDDVSQLKDDDLAEIRKNKIGFVFQFFNLLPRTTVLKNVILPLKYAKVKNAEDIAKKALESVGLGSKLFSKSNEISGGETQRVAIARSLVNNPAIILADEPTGNLDTQTGKEVMAIFQNLNQEGHTIIIITHESHIAKYARRVIRLQDGLIISDEVNA